MISYVDQNSLIWNVLLSETHDRAQRTEGPLSYADRGFSTNADSSIFEKLLKGKNDFKYTRMLVFITL